NPEPVREDVLCRSLDFIFDSRWGLRPNVAPAPRCGGEQRPADRLELAETIPPKVATALPVLYEDSLAIRPLFDWHSDDGLWRWLADDGYLDLVRNIRFDVDVLNMLWPGSNSSRQQMIVIESAVPHLHSDTSLINL